MADRRDALTFAPLRSSARTMTYDVVRRPAVAGLVLTLAAIGHSSAAVAAKPLVPNEGIPLWRVARNHYTDWGPVWIAGDFIGSAYASHHQQIAAAASRVPAKRLVGRSSRWVKDSAPAAEVLGEKELAQVRRAGVDSSQLTTFQLLQRVMVEFYERAVGQERWQSLSTSLADALDTIELTPLRPVQADDAFYRARVLALTAQPETYVGLFRQMSYLYNAGKLDVFSRKLAVFEGAQPINSPALAEAKSARLRSEIAMWTGRDRTTMPIFLVAPVGMLVESDGLLTRLRADGLHVEHLPRVPTAPFRQ